MTSGDHRHLAGAAIGVVSQGMFERFDLARARRGGGLADAEQEVRGAICRPGESEAARTEILDFVAAHPDALNRSCLEGHLTGSALVIDAARRRTLLLEHAKLGMWLQPGGHADGEGHLSTVALTEAAEETGIEGLEVMTPAIDCDVHAIPARPGEPRHLHLDVRYLVLAPEGSVEAPNEESRGAVWLGVSEVERFATDKSLLRLARVAFSALDDL